MKNNKIQNDIFAGEYQALYVSIKDEINKREGYVHVNGVISVLQNLLLRYEAQHAYNHGKYMRENTEKSKDAEVEK